MGVAMPKTFATSRRRPESASDGCKTWDRSHDFVRIIRVLPIADASQMICDWAISVKKEHKVIIISNLFYFKTIDNEKDVSRFIFLVNKLIYNVDI